MDDHDQRFKQLLELCLREFFDLFFPRWVMRFDWSRIEWLKQEAFTDPPQGQRRLLDLVAKVPLFDPWRATMRSAEFCVILIHIEIESGDSVAAFHPRMFDYYSWLRSKHQIPVLPIGLFLRVGLDGTGWIAHEEILWDEKLDTFRYPYIGLPELPALEHLQGENLLGVALAALMKVPESERARLKAEALQRLATSPQDAVRRFLMCECVEAYLPLEGPHLTEFDNLLLTPRFQEASMIAKTSYEKGIEKGIEKGQGQGQLAILRRQLQKRFGTIDPRVLQQLESLSFEQREQLAEDLMTATSLEQLGLTPTGSPG